MNRSIQCNKIIILIIIKECTVCVRRRNMCLCLSVTVCKSASARSRLHLYSIELNYIVRMAHDIRVQLLTISFACHMSVSLKWWVIGFIWHIHYHHWVCAYWRLHTATLHNNEFIYVCECVCAIDGQYHGICKLLMYSYDVININNIYNLYITQSWLYIICIYIGIPTTTDDLLSAFVLTPMSDQS